MQSELKILEGIILKELKNACSNGDIPIENLEQWLVIAHTQKEIIETSLVDNSFKCKRKRFKHYIQCHQSRLIFLANELYDIILLQLGSSLVLAEMYQVLENLLKFIQVNFPEHINPGLTIPNKTWGEAVSKFKSQLPALKRKWQPIDTNLFDIALNPFISALNGETACLTYMQLSYLDLLLSALQSVQVSNNEYITQSIVIERLINVNFNSWRFFNYMTDSINVQIKDEDNLSTQIKILSLHLKLINQSKVRADVIYNPAQKSINTLLSQWISEELSYFEKQLLLCQNVASNVDMVNFKVDTDFSVPQLACHLRVMHDIGMIKNENITLLTEFYANHHTTKKTNNISAESLRIKFNAVEDSARAAVKAMLIKMLNELNKHKLIICFCYSSILQQIVDTVPFQ